MMNVSRLSLFFSLFLSLFFSLFISFSCDPLFALLLCISRLSSVFVVVVVFALFLSSQSVVSFDVFLCLSPLPPASPPSTDNVCKKGDIVEIQSCRPLSKTKSFMLNRILWAHPHIAGKEDEVIIHKQPSHAKKFENPYNLPFRRSKERK